MPAWDIILVLGGVACWLAAGIAGLGSRGERTSIALALCGSLIGLTGAGLALAGDGSGECNFPWMQGWMARLAVDHLSAVFLLPVFLGGACATIYSTGYYSLTTRPAAAKHLRFFIALLIAAMAIVVTARQSVLFLLAWEVMALAAYFLITTEHHKPEVRQAGWVYLVTTHLGTLALIAMTVLLAQRSGHFFWQPVTGDHQTIDTFIIGLALIGFGCKAGFLPLHFWLPGAHAAAPSPASALLSGVMLKTGVYGILRISGLLPATPVWLGGCLVIVGCLTALFGIFHALSQADIKRLLAYSSIENLGLIALGIGLAWIGRATQTPTLVALGLGGALLHVWNHFLFKTLLFHGVGAVVQVCGTRHIERLGGLAKTMPATAGAMLVACLAVSALPPLNGFMGEWLLYRALFGSIHQQPWLAAIAIPALAFTGGLAAATFIKLFGIVFLGSPRDPTIHAHEASIFMRTTMLFLAGFCACMGVAAALVLPLIDRAVNCWLPGTGGVLVPLVSGDLGTLGLVCIALGLVAGVVWWHLAKRLPATEVRSVVTWDCGYAAPSARMQYSGRSLTAWLGDLVPGLRALRHLPRLHGLFPQTGHCDAACPDALGDRFFSPRLQDFVNRVMRLRWLQQGHTNLYLLYVLIGLVLMFAWMLVRPLVLA